MSTEVTARTVERAQAGDDRALASVAGQARAVARQVLARLLMSREDVEDCAQEVVLCAVQRLGQLRDPARFAGWVAVIARRTAAARQRDSATLPLPLEAAESIPQCASKDTPLQTELARAQARLCPARRRLLDLRYRLGLSYAEIAAQLRTTEPIVRRRLQGARGQLRKEAMKHMADGNGNAVNLSREDLDCLLAVAALCDATSERFRALYLSGQRVSGGTDHRRALGVLGCRRELPDLVLESDALLALADHPDTIVAALGWDEEQVRLALDDGTVIRAGRMTVESLDPKAWDLADWPLPHSAEASRAELLELAELIAAAAWGWGQERDAEQRARAAFTISPSLIGATVYRHEKVAVMMSGSIGAHTEADAVLQTFLNRGYLRECVAALPRTAERVRIEFGGPLQALRFSCPDRAALWTMMMPMTAPEGVDFRVVTSGCETVQQAPH